MKKVIIVSRRLIRKDKPVNWVSEVYLQLMAERGLMTVIVPIAEATKAILHEYLVDYDGMLLMEGGDLSPSYYGEDYNASELDEIDPLKDEIEIACIQHAMANNKPILGFCRGLHIINAMHGGKMYKDVQEANHGEVLHMDYDNYDGHRHNVRVMPNTPLARWYKEKQLQVNTYHHQGIKQLGVGLEPMAYAEDGLIEGVYNPQYRFLVGLQFHPERMLPEHLGNAKVFDAFAKAVKA